MSSVQKIDVENIKCGGCERSIRKGLGPIEGISQLEVDRGNQQIRFTGTELHRTIVAKTLRDMGYPEKDTLTGVNAGIANAKSFVSCAIGRIS